MNKPLRRCIACRASLPKSELIRIIKTESGIILDLKQRADGRGTYICKTHACLDKCKKSNALNRAYKQQIDSTIYAEIEAVLNDTKA